MKKIFAIFIALCCAPALSAQETVVTEPELLIHDAGTTTLEDFAWVTRPLIIFADSPNDPRFAQQMAYINALPQELFERDVVVITDTDPAANSPLRETLRPRGFMLVLIGKDGKKYLRKPFPWDVREITRSIDKLPMRQQEMEDRREGNKDR